MNTETTHKTKEYNGVKLICKNGLWGIQDILSNKKLTECIFSEISNFENGYAYVKKDNLIGIINHAGELVIPCNYIRLIDLGNTYYIAENIYKGYGLLSISGKVILPFHYSDIHILGSQHLCLSTSNKKALASICGEIFTELKYHDIKDIKSPSYFIVNKYNLNGEYKFGIISSLGQEIIPCVYNEINLVFHDSVFLVKKVIHSYFSDDNKYETYGIYDHMGNEIIRCEYDKIVLDDYLVIVTKGGRFGVIKYTGETIIPMQKHPVYKLDETYYAIGCFVIDKDGVFYIIKKKDGKMFHTYDLKDYFKNMDSFSLIKIPKEYRFPIPLSNNYIICKKSQDNSRLLGLINVEGVVMLPFEYSSITMVPGTNNFFQVEKYNDGTSDIYKYNELTGKITKIYYGDYESIRPCEHSVDYFILISQEHKYGLISGEGSVIIPCKYNYIYLPNAMFVVLRNNTNNGQCDYDLYSIEDKYIVLKNISDFKFNGFIYCNVSKKESQWIPNGDKRQIAIAVQKDSFWQLKNAEFADRGRRLYDNVSFESYGVIGEYGLYQDVYDCFGNFIKCSQKDPAHPEYDNYDPEYPEFDDRYDGQSWEELGKDEEDYIINNGGDWILDNW